MNANLEEWNLHSPFLANIVGPERPKEYNNCN